MIRVDNITRTFGTKIALDQVSFKVPQGTITGFIGSNGAGKTTAMRIIMNVLHPDSGVVYWKERPVTREIAGRFGYMPEERGLYPKMTVEDQMTYFARLHGWGKKWAKRETGNILEELEFGYPLTSRIDALSLGNQQKVQLAACLVHNPIALILDEPFSGLDPNAVDVVLSALRKRCQAGVPILLSSHQIEVVEKLCDTVTMLNAGKVISSGDLQEIKRKGRETSYLLQFSADWNLPRELVERHQVLAEPAGDNKYIVSCGEDKAISRFVSELLDFLASTDNSHVRLIQYSESDLSLAEVFRNSSE